MKMGVDLGGSKILSILVDDSKETSKETKKVRVLKQFQCDTEADKGQKRVIENVVRAIRAVMPKNAQEKEIEMIGVASAGNVFNGKMYGMNNFNIPDGFPLEANLKEFFPKIGIKIENDVNCFILAEHSHFLKPNMIGITLGTGIGGGIIIGHELYSGSRNASGELGHMVIVADGEKCTCGRRGCFEAYCSVRALERYYYNFTGKRKSALDISRCNDSYSKKAIAELERYLGIAIANIANIFDPDMIVIGGGLSNINGLIRSARAGLKNARFLSGKTRIVKSFFGKKSPAIGATKL